MKLLLIEDDKETVATLKEELERDYIVETSLTGEDGEYKAEINAYDLIILDLGLPDIDGVDVCRKIRASGIRIPLLVLTGEDSPNTKVSLLDGGADDYVTKPFTASELKARLRALLRRHHEKDISHILSTGDLTLDLNQKIARRGTVVIPLRRKEFYLLEYLLHNTGRVMSRSLIMEHVWESDCESITNIVDVHIKYLRDRIDKPFEKKLIKTVHGLGYKIEA